MDCCKLETCPFFNDTMHMSNGIETIFKKKYCRGSSVNCACYLVIEAVGSAQLPHSLYPSMTDLVQDIIDAAVMKTGTVTAR